MSWRPLVLVGALCITCSTPAQPGSLDLSFNCTSLDEFTPRAIAVQADGKVLVACWPPYLFRLNPNGEVDQTYTANPFGGWDLHAVVILPDGKVLVAGSFTTVGGVARTNIVRLNAGGTLDPSFTLEIDDNTDQSVTAIAVQPDGKILAGGRYYVDVVNPVFKVMRYNADGTVDDTFAEATELNFPADVSGVPAEALVLQPDGKILVAGRFTTCNGYTRRRVARLNVDGTVDPGFDPGYGGDNGVYDIALQPDGKIILGGYFTSFNTVSRNRIVRLNADGSVDPAYGEGLGFINGVEDLVLMPDGRVLAGGYFWSVGGVPRNYIARLGTDGTLDTEFDPGTGCDQNVQCLALQADGKVLIGGAFSTVDGVFRRRIARLNGSGTNSVPDAALPCSAVRAYPNPATDRLYCAGMPGLRSACIVDMLGTRWTVPMTNGMVDVEHLAPGRYVLEVGPRGSGSHVPFVKL